MQPPGKGGTAQVFLATEDDLDNRKVVLKISEADGREASILAHLRHPNIVSVLAKIEMTESGLRGFSMLYCPGITLDRLIRSIRAGERLPRTAREVWKLLGAPAVAEPRTGGDPSGWDDFPMDGTFHDAIAWIGLCLANALTHAHKEGILHRDVKPANVLLAFDEGPKLFDFNLADDPRAPEEAKAAHKGGTLPYMAPEQLHAFVDPKGWDDVGNPADLFSLGLVLREIVTGRMPELPDPSLPLTRAIQDLRDRRSEPLVPARKLNPEIPPALDSILGRCLEPTLARRYTSARELAEDLRLFLDRRPLKHAPNTSIVERTSNLTRRNRRGLLALAAAILALAMMRVATRDQPFYETKAFANAIADLDAGRLERARAAFATYYEANQSSAWSRLYYGLTLQRLGRFNNEMNRIFLGLPSCNDAEAALLHRLKTTPGDSFLMTELGMTYGVRHLWAKARASLEIATNTREPDEPESRLLAEAEYRLGDLDKSVSTLKRAIVTANESGIGELTSMHLAWNQIYIKRLPELLNEVAREPTSYEVQARVSVLLTELEDTLKVVDLPWSDAEVQRMEGSKDYCLNYYYGIAASGRAILALDEGLPAEMDRQIREAASRFREASRIAHDKPWPIEQLDHLRIFSLPDTVPDIPQTEDGPRNLIRWLAHDGRVC